MIERSLQTETSTSNPQQVLPSPVVALESQALRDLESRDNAAFDCFVSLAWPFGNVAEFLCATGKGERRIAAAPGSAATNPRP